MHVISQKADSVLFKIFNHQLIIYIGKLSYSIYVWQQIFLIPTYAYPEHFLWWTSYPINVILAFFTAMVSYHFLEMPLLRFKIFF